MIFWEQEIVEVFKEDFGVTPVEVFSEFDRTPIAAASLAQVRRLTCNVAIRIINSSLCRSTQVHKAKLHDGQEVAVKVLLHAASLRVTCRFTFLFPMCLLLASSSTEAFSSRSLVISSV